MECPDRLKLRYRLYREFLARLSPKAARIKTANWRLPVTSPSVGLLLLAKDQLYSRMPLSWQRVAVKKFRKIEEPEPVGKSRECLEELLKNCRALYDYLSVGGLEETGSLGRDGFDNLFTIASLIEEVECGKSTLEKYRGEEFA